METKHTPETFVAAHPRYVYRSGHGKTTVQWREAALDMSADRDRLKAINAELVAENARLRDALLMAEGHVRCFYTATMTNAKSRDENQENKRIALSVITAALTKAGA